LLALAPPVLLRAEVGSLLLLLPLLEGALLEEDDVGPLMPAFFFSFSSALAFFTWTGVKIVFLIEAITVRNCNKLRACLLDLMELSQSVMIAISSSTARSLVDKRVLLLPLLLEAEAEEAGVAAAAAGADALAEEEETDDDAAVAAADEEALVGRSVERLVRPNVPPPALKRAAMLLR
jgi:hypothetical protein